MGNKSLAPGYARMTYTGVLFPHHMTIPVLYDGEQTPGLEPNIVNKNGDIVPGETAMTEFATVLQPFYHSSIHLGLVEFHSVDADTGLDTFIYSFDLGLLGTAGGAPLATGEAILTYKTRIGSLYRLYLMEGSFAANVKALPPMTETRVANLNAYVVGPTSMVYGRKNDFPFTVVSYVSKYNDKLRKQQGFA